MNFIIWLVVGGVIGWLASMLMKTNDQQGMVLNVVVGTHGFARGGDMMRLPPNTGWLDAPRGLEPR